MEPPAQRLTQAPPFLRAILKNYQAGAFVPDEQHFEGCPRKSVRKAD